jgi:adenosylmethionine-8-amino-7-oxononanoate aminotransferase
MSNLQFDQQHIWHPYNRLPSDQPALAVKTASGCVIQLENGETLIDAMSSWWSAIHGYNHPAINAAAIDQIQTLSHIMFGGLTHQPAVELAQKLIQLSPEGLDKIFFADSGSIAVDVALKVALQYWKAKQQPQKSRFLALEHAYHGDTFGAMSVCDPVSGMHHLFHDNLMPNLFAPAPLAGLQINDDRDLRALEQLFAEHHTTLAAFIIEPMVQGAGGMRFYRPAYLKRARELCDTYNVLLIADEIATGFGRTGKLFACEWADISPDIMCVGKGLTAGYITLAAMLCTADISDTIGSADPGLLMHGPTFMANPLACRIANASIEVLMSYDWQNRVAAIHQHLSAAFASLNGLNGVRACRVLGAIGVIELEQDGLGPAIQRAARQKGVWLRPFGKLVYTMPAYTISEDELRLVSQAMVESVQQVLISRPANSANHSNIASSAQFV